MVFDFCRADFLAGMLSDLMRKNIGDVAFLVFLVSLLEFFEVRVIDR